MELAAVSFVIAWC